MKRCILHGVGYEKECPECVRAYGAAVGREPSLRECPVCHHLLEDCRCAGSKEKEQLDRVWWRNAGIEACMDRMEDIHDRNRKLERELAAAQDVAHKWAELVALSATGRRDILKEVAVNYVAADKRVFEEWLERELSTADNTKAREVKG